MRSASVRWKQTTHIGSQKLLGQQRGAGGSSGGVPPDFLGKDEVASSNLASSSKNNSRPIRVGCFFIRCEPDLKTINATPRWGVAATSANTGGYINLHLQLQV